MSTVPLNISYSSFYPILFSCLFHQPYFHFDKPETASCNFFSLLSLSQTVSSPACHLPIGGRLLYCAIFHRISIIQYASVISPCLALSLILGRGLVFLGELFSR